MDMEAPLLGPLGPLTGCRTTPPELTLLGLWHPLLGVEAASLQGPAAGEWHARVCMLQSIVPGLTLPRCFPISTEGLPKHCAKRYIVCM